VRIEHRSNKQVAAADEQETAFRCSAGLL